jgi:hypothetical protein
MINSPLYNPSWHFESLFKIISSNRFLNKEGLGGELPFFIHSFPVTNMKVVQSNIHSLVKRLNNEGIEVIEINLYHLCIDLLKREGHFETIIRQETKIPKIRLLRQLMSILNIENVVIPEIQRRVAEANPKLIVLSGVGEIFPILRSHTILNNTQTLVGNIPLVMFFPGTYNNQSLTLFDRLKDDNYYRAHNLNDYKI